MGAGGGGGELKPGSAGVIVTLAALSSGGSFDAGQQMASQTAPWLAQHSNGIAGRGSRC
jgi:hypothetical protein